MLKCEIGRLRSVRLDLLHEKGRVYTELFNSGFKRSVSSRKEPVVLTVLEESECAPVLREKIR